MRCPDIVFAIQEQIAEGDKVASRFGWTGTHKGEFLGIAATGRPVRVWGMVIDGLENGRVKGYSHPYGHSRPDGPARCAAFCAYALRRREREDGPPSASGCSEGMAGAGGAEQTAKDYGAARPGWFARTDTAGASGVRLQSSRALCIQLPSKSERPWPSRTDSACT